MKGWEGTRGMVGGKRKEGDGGKGGREREGTPYRRPPLPVLLSGIWCA